MDNSELNFYTVMLDINKGGKSIDDICELHQFPGAGTDDYILLNNTYTVLKKKEAAGTLSKEEPSLKTSDGSFDLNDYLRQKIWWYSGPEKYYMMEEDLKYMSMFLADCENRLKEKTTFYERTITDLKQDLLRIEQDYKRRVEQIKIKAKSSFITTVITIVVVAAVPLVVAFYRG